LGGKLIKFIFKIGIRFYARWCEQEIKKNFVLIFARLRAPILR